MERLVFKRERHYAIAGSTGRSTPPNEGHLTVSRAIQTRNARRSRVRGRALFGYSRIGEKIFCSKSYLGSGPVAPTSIDPVASRFQSPLHP